MRFVSCRVVSCTKLRRAVPELVKKMLAGGGSMVETKSDETEGRGVDVFFDGGMVDGNTRQDLPDARRRDGEGSVKEKTNPKVGDMRR